MKSSARNHATGTAKKPQAKTMRVFLLVFSFIFIASLGFGEDPEASRKVFHGLASRKLFEIFIPSEIRVPPTIEDVKQALEEGANPNYTEKGIPVLTQAVSSRSMPEMIELLLEAGADANAKSADGATPLITALQNRVEPEIVKILIDHGARVDGKDASGNMPLFYTGPCEVSVVELLLDEGADLKEGGEHAFKEAVSYQNDPMVLHLLKEAEKQGLKFETLDEAFLDAVQREDIVITSELLDHGANINAMDSAGENALAKAAAKGSLETLALLLAKGVEVNPFRGQTPLLWATMYEDASLGKVNALLEQGANINVERNGASPMINAARSKRLDIVIALVNHGADGRQINLGFIQAAHEDTDSVLNPDQREEKKKMMEFLLSHGAVINARDDEGKTALMYAAAGGDIEIVKYLLSKDADVNVEPNKQRLDTDSSTWSPIGIAASRNHPEVVQLLLESGTDTHWKNVALLEALMAGSLEAYDVLEEHGAILKNGEGIGIAPSLLEEYKKDLELKRSERKAEKI